MQLTPLQSLLGLGIFGPDSRMTIEAVLAAVFAVVGLAVRRRRILRTPGFAMCAFGLLLDVGASPRSVQAMAWPRLAGALAVVLVSWGLIRLMLDAGDLAARRSRAHFSTIFKELLMALLYGVVVLAVLREDFSVDPTHLLASTAVVAVVVGLALQESLSNIFSGLTLQLGKPFAPGDWVRSGNHIGRIQGIGWRSTAMITRANEKLEIPNAALAKDILVNFSNGIVGDEISIGLSYNAPPNYVHEIIMATLRDAPGVLQHPPPDVLTWEYGDYALRYRIKYWLADYAEVERVRDAVNTSLWYALRRKAIDVPYPVRTLRMQPEPAAGAGAEQFELEIMAELRQVDFLHALSDEELRLLLPGVTLLNFGTGEIIVREGDQGDSLFIIRHGTVEVVAASSDGNPVHIHDLKRPAFFGEIALMTGEPRNATIRARTDAELLELNRDGFTELFKAHPETAAQMSEIISLRMTETRELLAAAPHGDGARTRANWLVAKMRSVFNLASLR
jgi:small-conductance mechanosensitive channel/CRP-like cAMP-binding protein